MKKPDLDESLARILALVRARESEMLALTRRWVEINSFTANIEGVDQVGGLLREAFALPGLTCTRIPAAGFGEHLVWKTAAPGPAILLVGHHDTVFPPGHFEGW
nr:hypothetical protein [Deltaproteobacteria bacterium]